MGATSKAVVASTICIVTFFDYCAL